MEFCVYGVDPILHERTYLRAGETDAKKREATPRRDARYGHAARDDPSREDLSGSAASSSNALLFGLRERRSAGAEGRQISETSAD